MMTKKQKRELQEEYARRKIGKPVILDSKLLKKQAETVSDLTRVVNDDMSEALVGVVQFIEVFEWLPKGEHTIQIKIV